MNLPESNPVGLGELSAHLSEFLNPVHTPHDLDLSGGHHHGGHENNNSSDHSNSPLMGKSFSFANDLGQKELPKVTCGVRVSWG